jgi:hypothetical protein
MVEKKENTGKNFDLKDPNQYFELIKKYCVKLLKLDPQTYFFIVPGILLLIGLIQDSQLYFAIIRLYLFISALVLGYKFYTDEKDNIFAGIFAVIAIIYNPVPGLVFEFRNDEINTAPIIFVLTIALFLLGYKRIKEDN